MNVLIIPDKFKGSLTAKQVIRAIQKGLTRWDESVITHAITASDGGDGFLDAVCNSQNQIKVVSHTTSDPLGRPIVAEYGFDSKNAAAYIEMARASGMELLSESERNPMLTSTLGTGKLMADAISRGAKQLYIGLGGSATNDGGIGIATALGFQFLDAQGDSLEPIGGSLAKIASIDRSRSADLLKGAHVRAINDVTNPLLGPEGAAAVYAPQKGADPSMVNDLESGLAHLEAVVRRDLTVDAATVPGAGAAGGTGYGLHVFANAEFLSGIEFVLSLTGIEPLLAQGSIDWIITGEGKIDDQTAYGKLVRGVAQVGGKYDVPVVALCGMLDLHEKSIDDLGLVDAVPIHDPARDIQETMDRAGDLVAEAAATLLNGRQGDTMQKRDA